MTTETTERLLTAEEFMDLPDAPGGEKMELVRGRVVLAPPADAAHGFWGIEISTALRTFVRAHQLGRVTGEGGYLLSREPDVVRAPDTAWVSFDRLPAEDLQTGYPQCAPNLAVEVISPNDLDVHIADKVDEYLEYGVERVWLVRPKNKTVTVHRPGGDAHTYSAEDTLTSDDAAFPVEGFALKVADIFA